MRWEGAVTNTVRLLNLHCEARTSFSESAQLMSSKKGFFLPWFGPWRYVLLTELKTVKVSVQGADREVYRICTSEPWLWFPVFYETQLIFFMSIARAHKKICFGIVIFPLMKPLWSQPKWSRMKKFSQKRSTAKKPALGIVKGYTAWSRKNEEKHMKKTSQDELSLPITSCSCTDTQTCSC